MNNSPVIFGLGTAVPEHIVKQDEYARFAIDAMHLPEKEATFVKNLCMRSGIKQRHFVVADPLHTRADWHFLAEDYPSSIPLMTKRNDWYKREAPLLAHQSTAQALAEWGGDVREITHVVSVSCTGVLAPGIEFLLIDSLGLSRSVQRYGLNFMGCFGAFRGLAMAKALAQQDERHRILMVCTELCSLHFQAKKEIHYLISNAIFADGSAAVVIGSQPRSLEKGLWELGAYKALAVPNSLHDMTWEASEHGYLMYLSAQVPQALQQHAVSFAHELLGDVSFADCYWPLHPGGKAIIERFESACHLERWQTQATWDVMADYGNMSSATFLFVLDRLRHEKDRKKSLALGMAFGPGLSMEGMVLRDMMR